MKPLALLLLIPAVSLAAFTLGGPEPPTLTIGGHVRFGPVLELSDAEETPLGFENLSASLLFTGRLPGSLNWIIHPSLAGGRFALLDCYGNWRPLDGLGLIFGHHKAPLGRALDCSAAGLLFATRNPLAAFAPGYQLGITPVISLPAGRATLRAGVYNGNGWGGLTAASRLMYAAALEITPLGPVPNDESAHRGYDRPVVALIPGVWTGRVPLGLLEPTTTVVGLHAALRADYLALDAAFYRRWETARDEATTAVTDGLSIQGGYAFAGRYEPIARVSMVGLEDSEVTLEAGFNWYLAGYASRLGLNFADIRTAAGGAHQRLRLYYEYQF